MTPSILTHDTIRPERTYHHPAARVFRADTCRLTIVDQVTSFAGDGPIEGSRHGYGAMLDQLERHLAGALPATEEVR